MPESQQQVQSEISGFGHCRGLGGAPGPHSSQLLLSGALDHRAVSILPTLRSELPMGEECKWRTHQSEHPQREASSEGEPPWQHPSETPAVVALNSTECDVTEGLVTFLPRDWQMCTAAQFPLENDTKYKKINPWRWCIVVDSGVRPLACSQRETLWVTQRCFYTLTPLCDETNHAW